MRGSYKAYRAQRRADKIRSGGGLEVLTEEEGNEMTVEEISKFEKGVGFRLSTKFPSAPCFMAIRRKKFTRKELDEALADWNEARDGAEAFYGHISDWDVGEVRNMSALFHFMPDFDEDISRWDVSNLLVLAFWELQDFHTHSSFYKNDSLRPLIGPKHTLGLVYSLSYQELTSC